VIAYYGGVDFGVVTGTEALAVLMAEVIKAGWDAGYGNFVKLASGDIEVIYAHLSELRVRVGETVSPGQVIGLTGSTGNSSGPHLHFEVRFKKMPVDPWPMLSPHPDPLPGGEGETPSPDPGGEPEFYGHIPAVTVLPKGKTLDGLRLRGGPSTNWPTYGAIPEGEAVEFTRFEVEGRNLWGCIGGYPVVWMAVYHDGKWLVELEGVQ